MALKHLEEKELRELLKKELSECSEGSELRTDLLTAPAAETVEKLEHLFRSLAKKNAKLNKSSLSKQLQTLLRGDREELERLSQRLVEAQRLCYSKSKQISTGMKVKEAVFRVAMQYKQSKAASPVKVDEPTPAAACISSSSSSSSCTQAALAELKKAAQLWESPAKKRATLPVAESPASVVSIASTKKVLSLISFNRPSPKYEAAIQRPHSEA